MLKFGVDFDGTLVDDQFPGVGTLKPRAKEALSRLREAGHKVILWTCRDGKRLEEAVKFLADNDIVMDGVNFSRWRPGRFEETTDVSKLRVDYYLDDKSFPPFPGWGAFIRWCEVNGVI